MTTVCDGMLQANYMMGRATIAIIIGRLLTFCTLFLLVTYYIGSSPDITSNISGIILIFLSLILGNLVTFVISFYFVQKQIRLEWKIDSQFVWSIFKSGLPFGIITVINSLYFRFLPDYFSHLALTDKEFATFNISFRISQVLSLFSTFLMFSALPGLREYINQKHWQKVRTLYSKIFLVFVIGGILLVILGSLL